MRKLFTILSFFISLVGASQNPPQQSIGAPGNMVYARGFLGFDTAVVFRTSWSDTTGANLNPYLRFQAGAQIRVRDTIWQRSHDLSRWFKSGAGSIVVDTTSTISLFGDGSAGNPLSGTVIVSTASDNALIDDGSGLYVKNKVVNGLNSGGVLSWVSGYTYDVSAAEYAIGGIEYTAPETPITLANADPTLDRIDVVVATTSGTIGVITGTPAANPQEPSVDVQSELPLNFIYVTANTIEPVIPQDWIYLNDAEWTTASSTVRINSASTNNPYSPPVDIEGTAVQNGDNIRFTTVDPLFITDYNILTFKIRSKAVWVNTSKIVLQWYDASVAATGLPVDVANNAFGFQSSQTSDYQTISIPLTNFGALVEPSNLLMTISTLSGATIGFYIDDIQLQASEIPTYGNFFAQGGNVFGSDGVLGTNDNYNLRFITNNTERMRLLNTGGFIIGATAYTSSLSKLEVYGNTFIGGTSPKIRVDQQLEFDGSNTAGKFLFNAIGGNHALEVRKTSNNGIVSAFRNTTTDDVYMVIGSKTTATLSSTNVFPTTQGLAGYYFGYNIINSTSIWGPSDITKNHYMDFFPNTTGTSTSLIKMEAISSDLSVLASSKEIQKITMSARFISPNADHRVVIGSGTDDGSTALQITGSQKFTGLSTDNTATQILAKNASNLNVWRDVSSISGISAITANEGLTANTSTNVQLGGSLTSNRTITGGANNIIITGSDLPLQVTNTNILLSAIRGTNNSGGIGVEGTVNSGTGISGVATTGTAISAQTNTGVAYIGNINPSTANAVATMMRLSTQTSGTAANGLGGSIDVFVETDNGTAFLSNQIISEWTDATTATRTSRLKITGVNSAATADLFVLSGNGALQLPAYTTSAITGTAVNALATDASGNIIQIALPAGGMTNPMTTTGDVIYSTDGAGTPARLGIGTTGQVLQVSAGGIPEWVTPGVGGSVTSVAAAGTGIFSWTGSPITTSGTLTLVTTGTSGGGLYMSNGTTVSSTALLADNAIMIGGGAGNPYETTTTAAGIVTFIGTPSSANLASAVTDETGSGSLVFATSPTLTTPNLGTPSTLIGTNATGFPISTAISGLGTGVATALSVNTGSAGAIVLFNGNIGTPNAGTISTGVTLGDVTMNVTGTDAEGDMYYRNSSGVLVRMGVGTNGQIITSNGTIPQWSPASAAGTASVQGTLNQVLVNGTTGSPQTGAITLTLLQDIHTTATPTFYGLNLGPSGTPSSFSLVLQSTSTSASIHNVGQVNAVAGQLGIIHNQQGTIVEASSGNHPVLAGLYIIPPTIISGSATVTETASIYVEGAPSATVTGANYAVNINTGNIRVGGLAGAGRSITSDANGVLTLGFNRTVQTLTDGASITWNVTNGGNAQVTLAGTGRTLNISNPVAGETYTIEITQGSGGSKTITTWPTNTTWSGSNTLSTTAGDVDVVVFYYNGSGFRAVMTNDYD